MNDDSTKLLISVDYELFFGRRTGSIDRCLIEPTNALASVLEASNAKICLFVDAGYLVKIGQLAKKHPKFSLAYDQIRNQLNSLSAKGHDIQLHIHPHWEDCSHTDDGWQMNLQRYRLHNFDANAQLDLVKRYKSELEAVSNEPVFAYRAGGWCMQPFADIAKALLSNDIWLDSTAYQNGLSEDPLRWFNFQGLPKEDHWRFSRDPCAIDKNGAFVEVPISSLRVNPLFFWKMALIKKLSSEQHKTFGDGQAMTANTGYYIDKLLKFTHSPVSIDGIKASQLESALKQHKKVSPNHLFNVMGHPKSITPFGLRKLESFLKNNKSLNPLTFQDLSHLQPKKLAL